MQIQISAKTGPITEPWGTPFVLGCIVPSDFCNGAINHLSMYSNIHLQSASVSSPLSSTVRETGYQRTLGCPGLSPTHASSIFLSFSLVPGGQISSVCNHTSLHETPGQPPFPINQLLQSKRCDRKRCGNAQYADFPRFSFFGISTNITGGGI